MISNHSAKVAFCQSPIDEKSRISAKIPTIMHIGIDIRHLTEKEPAGVGGYTRNLLDALFRLDQTNEYVVFATGSPRTLRCLPKFDAPNVGLITVPIPNKLINASIALTRQPLLESLVKTKLDAWFFPNHNFISTSLPYVIMVHDLSYEIFPEFFTAKSRLRHTLARPIIKNANAVLCPSWSTKQDLKKIYGLKEEKIHVTPLAISRATESKPATALPTRYILSLATLEPRKNQLSIIEAYDAYRNQTRDNIALVVGGGEGWKSSSVIRAAKKSKFAKDIHLIGYVPENQKNELYRKAQVFVFPSFYEGFGLPVLEAMAAGCPVITSHTSSLPELAQDAALLVDPYNVNDLTQAIKSILNSPRLRADLIEKASRRAEDFSWEQTAKQTLAVLLGLS